uniref:rRNA N-glycosylase n=1 Tax=Oryza glaberrima TaxID=4538 RepID=I1PDY4_ORYGL
HSRCMHSGVATETRMEARGGLKRNRGMHPRVAAKACMEARRGLKHNRCSTSTSLKEIISTNLLILVVLSYLVHAVSAQSLDEPFRGTGAEIYEMTYDLKQDQQASFIVSFIDCATKESEFHLGTLKVLRNQTDTDREVPFGWILPRLIARKGSVTLAFRTDNLYLIGFTDKYGGWYSFNGYKVLIPGSTELEIDGGYGEGGMGGFRKLGDLPLSRRHALDAVDILWDYDPSTTPKEVLQNATATLLLVIPESARFKEVFEPVIADWDSKEGIRLKEKIESMGLLHNWGMLSSVGMIGLPWDSSEVQGYVKKMSRDKVYINSKEDAVRPLKVLLMSKAMRPKELVIKRINDPQS